LTPSLLLSLSNLNLTDKTDLIYKPWLNHISLPCTRNINLRSVTYVTAKEVRNSVLDNKKGLKDKNNVITNTENKSEPDFDNSDNDAFDLILSTNYDTADNNIDVD
jgi:hypothetical protein